MLAARLTVAGALLLISGDGFAASYGCGQVSREDGTLVAFLVARDEQAVTIDRRAPLSENGRLVVVTCTSTSCREDLDLGAPAPLSLMWSGPKLTLFSDALSARSLAPTSGGYEVDVRPLSAAPAAGKHVLRYDHSQCYQRPSAGRGAP